MKFLFTNYKNRLLLILIVLTISCLFISSQFQKGGTDNFEKKLIFIVIFGCPLFYIIFSDKLILLEKILFSFLSSSIAVTLSFIITGKLLDVIYGVDFEMYLNIFVANFLFYFISNFISIILLHFLLRSRGEFKIRNSDGLL